MVQTETSGRWVHGVCIALAVSGGTWALSSEADPGQTLGAFLVIAALWAWGWYSGPWRTFTRAGRSGALSLVPLYNGVVLLEIARKPGWWAPLWLIPGAQLVVGVRVLQGLSERFGRSTTAPVVLFLAAAAPFYYFSMAFLYVGLVREIPEYGHSPVVLNLGVKGFIAGVHVSIVCGCLPLGLGRRRPADEG